ncbi:hypothetical protein BLNAU_11936 [Blattamonas nauphoetae]|uniref:Uncharacterized protein n=1 Tax=Blattamonas nauphoetae TaxID=2049346 RepID=A0ABQ9XNS2_9EUKA|nr:hypothetical protein BLNAU_11936 [Blattamonas nauphoetae]
MHFSLTITTLADQPLHVSLPSTLFPDIDPDNEEIIQCTIDSFYTQIKSNIKPKYAIPSLQSQLTPAESPLFYHNVVFTADHLIEAYNVRKMNSSLNSTSTIPGVHQHIVIVEVWGKVRRPTFHDVQFSEPELSENENSNSSSQLIDILLGLAQVPVTRSGISLLEAFDNMTQKSSKNKKRKAENDKARQKQIEATVVETEKIIPLRNPLNNQHSPSCFEFSPNHTDIIPKLSLVFHLGTEPALTDYFLGNQVTYQDPGLDKPKKKKKDYQVPFQTMTHPPAMDLTPSNAERVWKEIPEAWTAEEPPKKKPSKPKRSKQKRKLSQSPTRTPSTSSTPTRKRQLSPSPTKPKPQIQISFAPKPFSPPDPSQILPLREHPLLKKAQQDGELGQMPTPSQLNRISVDGHIKQQLEVPASMEPQPDVGIVQQPNPQISFLSEHPPSEGSLPAALSPTRLSTSPPQTQTQYRAPVFPPYSRHFMNDDTRGEYLHANLSTVNDSLNQLLAKFSSRLQHSTPPLNRQFSPPPLPSSLVQTPPSPQHDATEPLEVPLSDLPSVRNTRQSRSTQGRPEFDDEHTRINLHPLALATPRTLHSTSNDTQATGRSSTACTRPHTHTLHTTPLTPSPLLDTPPQSLPRGGRSPPLPPNIGLLSPPRMLVPQSRHLVSPNSRMSTEPTRHTANTAKSRTDDLHTNHRPLSITLRRRTDIARAHRTLSDPLPTTAGVRNRLILATRRLATHTTHLHHNAVLKVRLHTFTLPHLLAKRNPCVTNQSRPILPSAAPLVSRSTSLGHILALPALISTMDDCCLGQMFLVRRSPKSSSCQDGHSESNGTAR